MTLKTVEEIVDSLFPQGTEHYWLPEKISDVITQDRQASATALLTALEGEKKFVNHGWASSEEALKFNQPIDQAITIVKELLTPTV